MYVVSSVLQYNMYVYLCTYMCSTYSVQRALLVKYDLFHLYCNTYLLHILYAHICFAGIATYVCCTYPVATYMCCRYCNIYVLHIPCCNICVQHIAYAQGSFCQIFAFLIEYRFNLTKHRPHYIRSNTASQHMRQGPFHIRHWPLLMGYRSLLMGYRPLLMGHRPLFIGYWALLTEYIPFTLDIWLFWQ